MSGVKEWFSAPELAGMPGMPTTERRVRSRAERGDWKYRDRAGRGGGREYHISALPEATRNHLLRAAVAALPAPVQAGTMPTTDLPRVDQLATWQREIMQARLAVCALINQAMTQTGVSMSAAIAAFCEAAASGALPADTLALLAAANARAGQGGRLADASTLCRWLAARAQGPAALAPRMGAKATPLWLAPLLKLYQSYPPRTVAACLRDWSQHYPAIPAPHPRAANRHIAKLPVELREYGRRGRRAMRSVQPFVRRTTDGLWPMDVVTVDGHLFKAYVRHPMTGRKQRPEITTYVDIATRKAVGFSAWLAESQMAIWAALRDMVLDPACGVPALHYSDNGAYRGDQHRKVIERIGSTLIFSEAYRAQA
jgi:putative transposase